MQCSIHLLEASTSTHPQNCQGHSAVVYNESNDTNQEMMYVFGGRIDTVNNRGRAYTNATYKYCFSTNTWTQIPPHTSDPTPRHNHSAIVYKKSMIIYGGSNSDGYLDQVYEYNFENEQWNEVICSGDGPGARHGHSECLFNNQMIVFGGKVGVQSTKFFNDVYSLDLDTNVWTKVKTTGISPSPRCWHGCTQLAGLMYIFGGFRFDGYRELYFADLFQYDPNTNSWSELTFHGNSPSLRNRQTFIAFRDLIILLGGNRLDNRDIFLDDIWLLKVNPRIQWVQLENTGDTYMRGHQTTVLHQNKLYLFGGEKDRQRFNDLRVLSVLDNL